MYKLVSSLHTQHFSEEFINKISSSYVKINIEKFNTGEKFIWVSKEISNKDKIILIHPLFPSPNESIIELLMILDYFKEKNISDVIFFSPFIPYLRSDKKLTPNSSLGARFISSILNNDIFSKIITIDAHSFKFQKYSDKIFNLDLTKEFAASADNIIDRSKVNFVVSPDLGGSIRAEKLAEILNIDFYILNKSRTNGKVSVTESGQIPKTNGHIIIVDDIIDSGKTIFEAAKLLHNYSSKILLFTSHVLNETNLLKISDQLSFVDFEMSKCASINGRMSKISEKLLIEFLQI